MSEANLYYPFELDDDLEVPVENVLRLGKKLKRIRNLLGESYPLLKGYFGIDLPEENVAPLSFRFWSLGITVPCFFESLFDNAGYFYEGTMNRPQYITISQILTDRNIPFKKSGFLEKKIIIPMAVST